MDLPDGLSSGNYYIRKPILFVVNNLCLQYNVLSSFKQKSFVLSTIFANNSSATRRIFTTLLFIVNYSILRNIKVESSMDKLRQDYVTCQIEKLIYNHKINLLNYLKFIICYKMNKLLLLLCVCHTF